MPTPQLGAQQINEVSDLVAQYIATQRKMFRAQALPLGARLRAQIDRFFTPQLLDAVTLVVLRGASVENPPFYPMLLGLGFSNLPDFSAMAAITFSDVVVSHQSFTASLLFHELVHAEQYRQLGIQRFAELYVRGFLDGGGYDGVPLEINAYALEDKFRQRPETTFSVEQAVTAWVQEGKF